MVRPFNPTAQNLPQNNLLDSEQARRYVIDRDYEILDLLYDSTPAVLSELIRKAFVPRPRYKFIVSDFFAVEARVLACLADESWHSKVFAKEKDIYCINASQMFGVPVEKHGINSYLRQKGKIAELALGYSGSISVLNQWEQLNGISERRLTASGRCLHFSNPHITKF